MVNNSLVAALGSVGAVDLNATTFTTPELLTSVAATGLFTLLILRHPRDPVGIHLGAILDPGALGPGESA